MKKHAMLALLLVLALTALSGCGSDTKKVEATAAPVVTEAPTEAPTAEPTAEPNLPKTGVGSLLPLWALLLLASCAGVLLLKARRRCN